MSGKKDRDRPMSDEEAELWAHATRETRPIENRASRVPAKAPEAPQAVRRKAGGDKTAAAPRSVSPRGDGVAAGSLDQLDGRNAQRLRRGRMTVEASLDLHGLTQRKAHAELDRFLDRAEASGKRCVLVITGKGLFKDRAGGAAEDADFMRRGESGVLRSLVPLWLREGANRNRILAFHSAQPRDGGEGALYVLLRRRRGGKGGAS